MIRGPSRLPGNTTMKAREVLCSPITRTLSNIGTSGMEIIDREREKEWLEQMDTILIFVGLTFLRR